MESKDLTKQVFLSYARKEQDLADAVAGHLSEQGIKVWGDREIPAGANWRKKVETALKQSDSMIVLLTPHSFSSNWVRNELGHALFDDRFKHRLLPVLIGNVSDEFVRLPWILHRLQFLRIKANKPTQARAKQIAETFVNLLKKSQVTE